MNFENGTCFFETEINGEKVTVDIFDDGKGNYSGSVEVCGHTYKADHGGIYGVDRIEASFGDLFNALVALDDDEDCGPGMILATDLAPYFDN